MRRSSGLINVRLSPEGKRLALIVSGDLWVYDLTGRPPIRLTFDGGNDMPLWTRDGQRLIYSSGAPAMGLLSVLPFRAQRLNASRPGALSRPWMVLAGRSGGLFAIAIHRLGGTFSHFPQRRAPLPSRICRPLETKEQAGSRFPLTAAGWRTPSTGRAGTKSRSAPILV